MPNAPLPSHAVQVLSSAARDERQVMLDVRNTTKWASWPQMAGPTLDAAMAKWQATVDARLDHDLDTYARQMLTVEQMVAGHLHDARQHQGTLSMARRSADLHQIHRLLKTLQQTAHELHHKKDAVRRRESHKQRVQKLRLLFRRAKIVWNSLFDGMMSAEVRHQYETAFTRIVCIGTTRAVTTTTIRATPFKIVALRRRTWLPARCGRVAQR